MSLSLSQVYSPFRSVTLVGRSMPERGLSIGGEQRVAITKLPGNPVGSAQILGAAELPLKMTGRWWPSVVSEPNNAILLNFPAIGPAGLPTPGIVGGTVFVGSVPVPQQRARTPVAIQEALDRLRYEGIPVKFQWETVVRYGVLRQFDLEFNAIDDIRWTLEMEVTGRSFEQPRPKPSASVNVPGLLEVIFQKLQALLDKLRAALDKAERWVNYVPNLAARVFATIDELFLLLDRARAGVTSPLATTEQIIAGLLNVRQNAIYFLQESASIRAPAVLAGGDPVETNDQALAVAAVLEAIREVGGEAALRAHQLTKLQEPSTVISLTGVQGQTLMSVAKAYYDDAGAWIRIRDYNGKTTWKIEPGEVILVPLGAG